MAKNKRPSPKDAKKGAFDIVSFAKKVRDIDDQLGLFSDYEGNKNGPTFYMYKQGESAFLRRCETAAYLHEKAARLWRGAKKQILSSKKATP